VTTTNNERVLERRLGPLDAAALIVSNVIGGGILFTPPQIAAAVPAALPFLSTWAAGGLLAFAGAMAYAELAALRPRAGGEYVYLREAFGRLAAFLSGWTSFIAGFSGAIASSAVILASYLGRFFPAAGNSTPFLAVPIIPGTLTFSVSPQTVVALAAIYGMAWVHLRGVGPGRVVGNILATLKVSALLLFIAFGFSLGQGSTANLTQGGDVAIKGWLLALIPVMFTYSGWNAASYVAEEVRDPGRNVPRALAIGTGAVVVLYLLLNALYIYVVPVDQLAAVKGSMLDLIADRLLGQTAGNIMAIVSIVSLLASISAMTFAGPRVYFAMGRDGVFFKQASAVHTRYKTPAVSILAQATWSSLLVLTAGADALVTYTGFAIVLFSGVAVVALFVLRAREPNAERPFRAWGYPVAPAIYVIASALILSNGLMNDPRTTGFGVIVILLGIPLFLLFRSRKQGGPIA
jgi:APA family basic amino acid/polyamine antiporter